MKQLIAGAAAALALSGCVAVPAPYAGYPGEAYYYPAPVVGVGVYSAPYYGHRHYHRGHRHWR